MIFQALLPLLELEEDPELKKKYLLALENFLFGYQGKHSTLPNGVEIVDIASRFPHTEKKGEFLNLAKKEVRTYWQETKGTGVFKLGYPLFNFLGKHFLGVEEDALTVTGIDNLRYFKLSYKMNENIIQNYERRFGFVDNREIESHEPTLGDPHAVDRCRRHWTAWLQNSYVEYDPRTRYHNYEYPGHDYYLAYWLGRFWGYVNEKE